MNRASTKRQYTLPAIFQYLFNFNELFQKRLCQGTYGFSFKLQGKCNILLVLLQRAGSINLAYETKIIDIRETKELLLDSLRASSPGRSGGGAGRALPPPPSAPEGLLAGYVLHDVNTLPAQCEHHDRLNLCTENLTETV